MIKTCENCNEPFEYQEWWNSPGRFCSRNCLFTSMRTHEETTCLTCGNIVRKKKYCSHDCYAKSLIGKRPVGADKMIGRPAWNKGKSNPKQSDELHHSWKGDNVGYAALHSWVRRKLGTPSLCEHCGKTDGKFQWSNVSRTYRRDLTDWQRLCQSCHGKYDRSQKKATGY